MFYSKRTEANYLGNFNYIPWPPYASPNGFKSILTVAFRSSYEAVTRSVIIYFVNRINNGVLDVGVTSCHIIYTFHISFV